MAKLRKKPVAKPDAPEPPPMPRIGDKVTMPRSKSVLEVDQVSRDGSEVALRLPGTNLQWFRIKASDKFGDGPDPDTVEGRRNRMTEAAVIKNIREPVAAPVWTSTRKNN